jgi:PTS system beta-glucosides-specific IIC component
VAVLIYPDFISTFTNANGGTLTLVSSELSKFIGIPVLNATYSSSVIPPILIAYAVKWIEVGVDKITPAVTKSFLKPFLLMLISAPIAFIVIGPIGSFIGMGFSWVIENLNTYVPVLVAIIMAVACPYLVMTGMHWALVPLGISALSTPQGEQLILPAMLAANISMGAATLAIAARTKDKDERATAIGAGFTACVGGITEPALYGVLLPKKKPLIVLAISCAVCGLISGISKIGGFAFVSPSFLGLTAFIKDGDTMNIVWASIVAGVAFVLSFGLQFFMPELTALFNKVFAKQIAAHKAKKAAKNGVTEASQSSANDDATVKQVVSPLAGKLVALADVPDETFATGVLGKGVAIQPANGKVYAPFNGTVETVMGHALGLKSSSGVELLIHVGLETVNLNGKHYTCKVKEGQSFKAGELLLECDLKAVEKEGYKTITPVIVTNSDDYANIEVSAPKAVAVGEQIIKIN